MTTCGVGNRVALSTKISFGVLRVIHADRGVIQCKRAAGVWRELLFGEMVIIRDGQGLALSRAVHFTVRLAGANPLGAAGILALLVFLPLCPLMLAKLFVAKGNIDIT